MKDCIYYIKKLYYFLYENQVKNIQYLIKEQIGKLRDRYRNKYLISKYGA
jgi:hypothetical protein